MSNPSPVPSPTPQADDPRGVKGMANDPSTLASTGLIAAVLFAVVAGVFNVLSFTEGLDARGRLMQLTDTVDVGDVALLGIAVALLVATPDPPGGIPRPLLLKADAVLAFIIAAFGVVRAVVLLADATAEPLARFAGFLATLGVAIAAATVAFYAAKESAIKSAD